MITGTAQRIEQRLYAEPSVACAVVMMMGLLASTR